MAREDRSGRVEARTLASANSESAVRLLYEDIIHRHRCFTRLVIDGGLENKDVVVRLAERYGFNRILSSAVSPVSKRYGGKRPSPDHRQSLQDNTRRQRFLGF